MTSYINVQRICEQCGMEFTARTTTTQYCSPKCSRQGYKVKKRAEKVDASNNEVKEKKIRSGRADEIKIEDRTYLSVPQVATLLGCTRQNVYHLINTRQLKASNLLQRKTIVARIDLVKLIEDTLPAFFECKIKAIAPKASTDIKVFFRYARVKKSFQDIIADTLINYRIIKTQDDFADISNSAGGIDRSKLQNILNPDDSQIMSCTEFTPI